MEWLEAEGPCEVKKIFSNFSSHSFVLAFDVNDRATNSCVVLWL